MAAGAPATRGAVVGAGDQPPAAGRAGALLVDVDADTDPPRPTSVADARESGWAGTHHHDVEQTLRIVGQPEDALQSLLALDIADLR